MRGARSTTTDDESPRPAGRAASRHAAGLAVRLAVAFAVHPALAPALLPLCLAVPPPAATALRGEDADAARAVRRIVRTATEDAWTGPSGAMLVPLLLRRHAECSARVAAATARAARRAAGTGLRSRLPKLYALLLSAAVLTLDGPALHAFAGEPMAAAVVFLTIITTPLRTSGDA
ncbi:hypothetical protein AGRA3207_007229 [Actinomadura graeca]|uniref:Uncharacterized protein n=1 Tax=Actinomadura graeca TaxID=2750812 RepID=A0ABX8R3R2_9ACTN|nr:hypothetical protein [Actinomadura graeca]QXJ25701.1 hypothetical protein AGRA3207_007229 [Actinomadura graeca]